jgi:hypothetical protein
MSTTLKPVYGAASAVAVTINNLANASQRQSTAIDNSSTLADDYMLDGNFKTSNNTLGTNPVINLWVSACFDGSLFGGSYGAGANVLGGGDAAYALPANTGDLALARSVPINVKAESEQFNGVSVASLFGGVCPKKFVIIVDNQSGVALDASAAGALNVTPIQWQNV